MDDVRSNLTQEASAWNSIKYAIDPTLGTYPKRIQSLLTNLGYRSQFEAFGRKVVTFSNVLYVSRSFCRYPCSF